MISPDTEDDAADAGPAGGRPRNQAFAAMRPRQGRVAGAAYLGVLAAGYFGMLIANLPGHLTLDSILELYEGRFRIRQSWAPSFYAWVLGVFDAVWRGTGLYVAASALLLFVALASFLWLRRGTSRGASLWAAICAALFMLTPQFALYQAVVWKDILFADTAIAGVVCLAWAGRGLQPRRTQGLLLAAALLLLAAAALLRQNGVVVAAMAAVALGVTRSRGSWRRALGWSLGAIVSVVVVSHAMNLATQPPDARGDDGMAEGMRILQGYDLLGAITRDPKFPLAAITRAQPAAAATLRSLGPRYYSAERTDTTDFQPQIHQALAAIPSGALAADWRNLLLRHPGLYLRGRVPVFVWVFLTPEVDRCVPVCLGVQGPADALKALGMDFRWSAQDDRLEDYGEAFMDTPVFSHLTYALLALGVALVLLLRREAADLMMIALMVSALAFAASFFLISIACDYRYLYFLDLAAMAGLLYVAVDPPAWRRPIRAPEARPAPSPPRR